MDLRNVQERVLTLKQMLDPSRIEREKRAERRRGLVKGLMIGAVLGGLAGVLLAPDTGKNNRRKAREELQRIKDIVEENALEGREKFSKIVSDGKEEFNKGIISMGNRIKYSQTFDESEELKDEE